jgi:hypothetical protein
VWGGGRATSRGFRYSPKAWLALETFAQGGMAGKNEKLVAQ